jgi:hypothetical protein
MNWWRIVANLFFSSTNNFDVIRKTIGDIAKLYNINSYIKDANDLLLKLSEMGILLENIAK